MVQDQTSEPSKRASSGVSEEGKYYTLRIKKREVHSLAVLFLLWFAWSQGAEVAQMFRKLYESLS